MTLAFKPNLLLVAYSEIALKSRSVRRRLEAALISHVDRVLTRAGLPPSSRWKENGRIFFKHEEAEAAAPLASRVFGVEYVAPAVRTEASLEAIAQAASALLEGRVKLPVRFAVRARRVGSHPYTSRDVEAETGRRLLEAYPGKLKVDLENPQLTVHVEVRGRNAYLYLNVFRGPGGIPLGSQGDALAILDHTNAAVALWLTMKRGIRPILLIPGISRAEAERRLKLARKLAEWTPNGKLEGYLLTLNHTSKALAKVKDQGLRGFLLEKAKVLASVELSKRLRLFSLILGLELKPNVEAALSFLAVLRGISNLLILTPLAGLTAPAEEVFKVLNLKREAGKLGFRRLPPRAELDDACVRVGLDAAVMRDLEGLRRLRVEA
ncbi:MAG: thiazole biosynthesis/tRNA modification protein ThiI [Candidatus Hecatellales archaeon B24]|nr:MAG: thiazole biosynthesis/tRNA modification protein ThiI [Candidatus Hecatellales archaeon B24]